MKRATKTVAVAVETVSSTHVEPPRAPPPPPPSAPRAVLTPELPVGPAEAQTDPVAERFARLAAHLTGAELVCVVLQDDGVLSLAASHGERSAGGLERWTALAAKARAPLVVSDVKSHGVTAVSATGAWRWVRRWTGLPIRGDAGQLEAVVHLFGAEAKETPAETQSALEELVGMLFAQIEMRNMVRSFAIASHSLKREKEKAQAAQRLTESILQAIPGHTYLFDVVRGAQRKVSATPSAPQVRPWGELIQRVHPEDQELVYRHYAALDTLKDGQVVELSYRTVDGPHVSWVLHREVVFRRDEQGRPSELLGVTNDVTSLVEAHESLQALARTDELTQLANPRHFRERLAQLVAEGRRGRQFALVLADIDHFKRLNDTFGHPLGDRVLVSVASSLRGAVRQVDLVARSGGEEFAVLFVDVEGLEARRLAERLRVSVQAHAHEQPVTISVGGACFQSGMSAEALVEAADVALYRAKQGGRNRVSWAEGE